MSLKRDHQVTVYEKNEQNPDPEWVRLVQEARALGLTPENIRHFLNKHDQRVHIRKNDEASFQMPEARSRIK